MAYLQAIVKHTSRFKLIFISKKSEEKAAGVFVLYIKSGYNSGDVQWFLRG